LISSIRGRRNRTSPANSMASQQHTVLITNANARKPNRNL
jgi:hypothetical protein